MTIWNRWVSNGWGKVRNNHSNYRIKVALVTGSIKGIGRAIVIAFSFCKSNTYTGLA
jgi:hypothetical protein